MTQHAFVLGGTGQIGRAVASELLEAGWRVTLGARGRRPLPDDLAKAGARLVTVDRATPDSLARALGEGADALVDTLALDPRHGRELLAVEPRVGALAVISTASVYADAAGRFLDESETRGFPQFPERIGEEQPTVAPGPSGYSADKAALERLLLEEGRGPLTLLRAGAVYGQGSEHPREWWFVKRMRDGRALIPLADGGRSRFHPVAAANLARLVRASLEKPGRRVLNVGDPEAPTVREIGEAVARHLGWTGRFVPLEAGDGPAGSTVGRTPWTVPGPLVLDVSAARALGGPPLEPTAEALGPVVRALGQGPTEGWERRFPALAAYPWPLFDYAAEDAALGR